MWQLLAGFGSGLLSVVWLPQLPDYRIIAAGAVVLLIFAGLLTVAGRRLFPLPFIISTMLGLGWSCWYGQTQQQRWLSEALAGQELTVTAQITSLPVKYDNRVRFMADSWLQADQRQHRLSLSWQDPPEQMAPGQHWQLCVRLKRPHGFSSPGARDYQAWMLTQGVTATGYVRECEHWPNELQALGKGWSLLAFRDGISRWLEQRLNGHGAALVRMLLLGDGRGLDKADWQLFRSTGTTHLMVISGLHISLIALVGWLLARLLVFLGLVPVTRWPLPYFGVLSGLVLALGYGLLAGVGLPVQRALLMVTVGVLTLLLGFRLPVVVVYLLALCAVLVVDPLASLAAGFWLSFVAVASLLFSFSYRRGGRRWSSTLMAQFVVMAALIPLLANLHQPVSLWSPLINIVSIPLVGLILVPVMMLGLLLSVVWTGGGLWLLQQAANGLELWESGLQWLSNAGLQLLWVPVPTAMGIVCALTGAVLLLSPGRLGWRWLGLLWLLPWLWPVQHRPEPGRAEVAVLDVGQGLAVLVQTHSHLLVYDTGDRFTSSFTAAGAVIVPYLRTAGIAAPDLVVISHNDRDHRGGLETLQEFYPSAALQLPEQSDYCPKGVHWQWDGVDFHYLGAESPPRASVNDHSCVLRICAGNDCALLTGDISQRREKALVQEYSGPDGQGLNSRLLLASHHGSGSSSSEGFLKAVQPQWIAVSCGYRNRFRHPSAKAVERMSATGAKVLITSMTGTQVFVLGNDVNDGFEPQCSRGRGSGWWSRVLPEGGRLKNCDVVR